MRPVHARPVACFLAAAAIALPSRAARLHLEALALQPPAPAAANPPTPADSAPRFTADELDDLVGPIALYPDVLLSAVLAASVFPDQVAAAAALVAQGAENEQLENQGWEDPVLAVAKVPEVVAMMGQYPDWTNALGTAFLIQSWDVMESVQRLRSIAFENGALQTTPQQIITVEQQTQHILIAPANPTIIYVPRYNPSVIFVRDNRSVVTAGLIGFGTGIAVGAIIWGGSTSWNSGVVVWGRGGWWGWSNSNNNRTTINVDNSRNTNININRPNNSTNVGINRLPDRIGNEGNRWTPDRNRPGIGGSATGPNASNLNRDRVNTWRDNRPDSRPPGSSIAVPPNSRPGLGSNRPGGINNDRPSANNRPGINNDRPSANNRPTTTPPANRLPSTRPGVGVGSGAGSNDRPINRPSTLPARPTTPTTRPGFSGGMDARAPGAISRPSTLPARPAGTPTTGNRTSAFSGGPGTAAANRGASSRAAAASARPAPAAARPAPAAARPAPARSGGGGGGGGGGGRGR